MGKITRSELRDAMPNKALVLRVRPILEDAFISENHFRPWRAPAVGGQDRPRKDRLTAFLHYPYSVQCAHYIHRCNRSTRLDHCEQMTTKLSPNPSHGRAAHPQMLTLHASARSPAT